MKRSIQNRVEFSLHANQRSSLLRNVAALAIAAALSSSYARAGDPVGATYPHLYGFGSAHGTASDVAVFAPFDHAQWVYVADRNTGRRVQRYDFTGASNHVSKEFALGFHNHYLPIGLAVNDVPGSCNYGDVYASDTDGVDGLLWIFNTNLQLQCMTTLGTASGDSMLSPVDVAVDAEGNVYVADMKAKKICKFAAADIAARTVITYATQDFSMGTQSPFGVSVDQNNRVHATVSGSTNHYQVFNPNGSLAATATLGGNPWCVCALNPCADGFLPRGPINGGYNFVRHNWDWSSNTGAIDLTAGAGWIARPEGTEYQKFKYSLGATSFPGWAQIRSDERLFVTGFGGVQAFGQSYLSVLTPPGKVAWWRFEEAQDTNPPELAVTMDDYLGGNDAIPGAVVPRTVEGMVGCGFDTRAGTAYTRAPDNASLDFGTGSMSIEGWIRTEQGTGVVTLLDKRVGTGAGYSAYIYNGGIGFQWNWGTGSPSYRNFGSVANIADGQWRHFAIVLDRTGANLISLYVNGALVNSSAVTGTALTGNIDSSGDLYIGCINPSTNGTAFQGGIDELTIYNQALTPAQVLGISTARSAGKHLWETYVP